MRAPGNYFPANGRFYSIGGRNADVAGADFTNPFEYNPATNTWATKVAAYPDNKVNNMACGVLTVGGTPQIYCVGGNASQVVGTTGRVFSYNPATDTITTLTAAGRLAGQHRRHLPARRVRRFREQAVHHRQLQRRRASRRDRAGLAVRSERRSGVALARSCKLSGGARLCAGGKHR